MLFAIGVNGTSFAIQRCVKILPLGGMHEMKSGVKTLIESVHGKKNQRKLKMRKPQEIRRLLIIILMLATIGVVGSGLIEAKASEEEAQTPQQAQVYQEGLTYYSGVVTAKQRKGIQIDQNDYPLHKELIIQDEEGRERKLQEFATGVRVAFHLKLGKVDQLILKLAR